MRASSFKAQYRQAPLRPGTPPPPVYEPISPVLGPSEPASSTTADARDISAGGSGGAPRVALQPARAPPHLTSPAVTYGPPPLRSAPLPSANPHFSPALGSPIDALADAAVSSLEASPAYHNSPRRPSYGPLSPAPAAPPLHTSERALKRVYPDGASAQNERAGKRARSELIPSPRHNQHYSRPATSHIPGWSYNVEQMVDNRVRMYQANAAPVYDAQDTQSKMLSDAQLLLDFHRNAATSPQSVQPHMTPAKRWSISHPEASDQRAVRTVSETISTKLTAPYNHLQPGGRTFPQTFQYDALNTHPLQNPNRPAMQTHTPPDDTPLNAIPRSAEEVDIAEERKPKKHAGWPKGKPRGPRTSSLTEKKKKVTIKTGQLASSSTTRPLVSSQLHSPQSLPADGHDTTEEGDPSLVAAPNRAPDALTLQTRRLSCSNTFPPQEHSPDNVSGFPRAQSVPLHNNMSVTKTPAVLGEADNNKVHPIPQATICGGCHSSDSLTSIGDGEQWINCDGCKGWFHYACAGIKSEREVRGIDKFYCDGCKPKFGDTTRVRKSSRAHTTVDYAGLNEGIMKTSDDNPEHHYIQAFKNGSLKFTPEAFARITPECATADFIEKMNGFREPMVIPAALNPRPQPLHMDAPQQQSSPNDTRANNAGEEQYGYELVPDDGQDKIDMVIPEGLTVRRVSELYGPLETVPVIDVKAQEGEDKRWTMAKWADYYEQEGEKPVRNVISLEVSRSKLGRLIRRPKVVRDMDLQDSVWPEDDKIHAPPVQFYCLMSVADCYTDFHIDFGGSSVYYHIVKGRKTFFFIPPTKQNLKKYEDWCLSPGQSHEFLGQQVKECYRVDLYPGDTMLIPSGWIHAVWTPEDSLVIGGNYLTRIHYGMQIKVLEIERNTKVAAKFRYPFFQKIMWLALIQYLEEDPLPAPVEELLLGGGVFERALPIYCEPDKFGHNSDLGPENYNRRYYPKSELEGLVDLENYIWRTVMISQGRIEGITPVSRNAVTRSIPKGHGEPMVLARRFAMWVAWKRGNERIPQWAHPDAALPDASDSKGDKKLTSAQTKKVERESWNETLKLVRGGERHSSLRARVSEPSMNGDTRVQAGPPVTGFLRPHREHVTTPKTSQLGPKRIACDACRKRRIRCKHKDELVESPPSSISGGGYMNIPSPSSPPATSSREPTTRRYSDADIPTDQGPFSSLHEVQGNLNGGPVSAEANGDSLANKSGRVKACADCRKSKRRCIHDEHGNVDPVKAAEAPVPRGSASKKRRPSDVEDGEALSKKMKMESFAGLVNGEVSQWNRYPLQKPRPSSAAESRDDMPFDSALGVRGRSESASTLRIDHQLTNGGGDPDAVHIPSNSFPSEAVVSSIEDNAGDGIEDMMEARPVDIHKRSEPRTPAPSSNNAHNGENGVLTASPTETSTARGAGNTRRASMTPSWPRSSKAGARSWNGKSNTPKTTTPGKKPRQGSRDTIKVEPKSDQKKPRAMSTTIGKKNEDRASLALALQLQMEEHGLRTRSK